jgi:hypothetical protein
LVVFACDLRGGRPATPWYDSVGHYRRAEALAPAEGAP